MKKIAICSACIVLVFCAWPGASQIKAVWLTHNTNEPTFIVVNWQSVESGRE